MASKAKTCFICSECEFESAKWYGKCPGCGEWNTMNEEIKTAAPKAGGFSGSGTRILTQKPTRINEINSSEEERYHTGLSELDRVLGGGIVRGSLILMSGDPGIGKSTMLLQICQYLGERYRILYVSGEESSRQIKLRAARLGVTSDNLYLLTETDVQCVMEHIRTE
ncbi:MAG: AAA family ATPase, partial [Anaerotignum sp.]|nr:AAA family ATPase [Anaerotignum sp.]